MKKIVSFRNFSVFYFSSSYLYHASNPAPETDQPNNIRTYLSAVAEDITDNTLSDYQLFRTGKNNGLSAMMNLLR